MKRDMSYSAVMERRNEIMKRAVGIDYSQFRTSDIAFDYEEMMRRTGYDLSEVRKIQEESGLSETPLIELPNLTRLARYYSDPGKGARIFIKDEASHPSGSFKVRRAAVSAWHAQKHGYPGLVAATSGNYGAAVASQAARRHLKSIIVQETYDSRGFGQPEILEKGRKCEAYGAEVMQTTVGPELFYLFLRVLEDTGFFNASLYTPFAIAGIETLGAEIARQMIDREGTPPHCVVVTHAGGGNLTGTARGLRKAGADSTHVVAASVNLVGLHQASDTYFNRKSFTTGHTGYGVPFAVWPDRADVPRNAARPLRYMERYVTVTQGQVFYVTEALAQLEGMERGPAGNTALAAAFAIAQDMDREETLVVQETEYTGAGKHPTAQLTFARDQGIDIHRGDPRKEIPGENIIIPRNPEDLFIQDIDLDRLRRSYLKTVFQTVQPPFEPEDRTFLMKELSVSDEELTSLIAELSQ